MGLGGASTAHARVRRRKRWELRKNVAWCLRADARIGRRPALPSVGAQTNIARIDSTTLGAKYAAHFFAHACIFALVQSRWLH